MKATKLKFVDFPSHYAGLVALYPPRPLHDGVDERNVEEIVQVLAGHSLNKDQEDYLDLLSNLLLKYQADHYPLRVRRHPVRERLKYLMEQSQMAPAELARILRCSQPLVSLILAGKRNLSKENVKKLAAHFTLDAGYFL
jgi:antitoxin component HigA of HigAB toxin-antitoxin module